MIRNVLILISVLAWSSSAWAEAPRMLVQDLKAKGVAPHEASIISGAACVAFAKSPKYEVLCGDDLRNLMQFGTLTASFDGCEDDSCYAHVGKAMQARFLVLGSVGKVGSKYILNLALLDTETGKTTARSQVKASSLEKLHEDTPEAVGDILKAKPKKKS